MENRKNGIYFKQQGQPKVPVEPRVFSRADLGMVVWQSPDQHVYLPILGNIAQLITTLRDTARELEENVCTKRERGILQGNAQPEPPQEFSLITLNDIPADDPATAWPLIAARFPWLADCVPEKYQRRWVDVDQQTEEVRVASQLELDLNTIQPHTNDLIDRQGNVRHGAKTKIARLLGGQPAGSFFYKRVEPVIEALQQKRRAA